jgi:hypothetical protein
LFEPGDIRSQSPVQGRCLALSGAIFSFFLLVAPPAGAQAHLYGTVLDDSTSVPISGAEVVLLDRRLRTVARAIADTSGSFDFAVTRPDHYSLSASRIGYFATTSPAFEVQEGDSVALELRLATDAVLLAPLEITARRRSISPVLDGFLHRKQRGFGHYFTAEDIARRNAFLISDMLVTLPGVRVGSGQRGGRGRNITMARALPGEGNCPVQVFLDGFHMNPRALVAVDDDSEGRPITSFRTDHGFVLDDVISPNAIYGIEVYRGLSTIPAEFLTPDSRCGTVVIWTKRGGTQPARR